MEDRNGNDIDVYNSVRILTGPMSLVNYGLYQINKDGKMECVYSTEPEPFRGTIKMIWINHDSCLVDCGNWGEFHFDGVDLEKV